MQIRDLHYNHRTTAFEADVLVGHRNGQLRIACRVPGQVNLDPAIIKARMVLQASRKALSY